MLGQLDAKGGVVETGLLADAARIPSERLRNDEEDRGPAASCDGLRSITIGNRPTML